jgi:hypothetical protein
MVENLLPLTKKHCKIFWTSKTENLPTLLLPNIMGWKPDRTANGKAMQDLLPIQTGLKSFTKAGTQPQYQWRNREADLYDQR